MTAMPGTYTPPQTSGFSVGRKLALLAVLATVVPAGLIVSALVIYGRDVMRDSVRETLVISLESTAAALDRSFTTTQNTLDTVARILADSTMSSATRVAVATDMVAGDESITQLGVYDETGALVDTVREQNAAFGVLPAALDAELTHRAQTEGRALATTGAHRDAPRVLLAVPVAGVEQTWYVATHMALEPVQRSIEEFTYGRYASELVISVIDENRRILAHSHGDTGHVAAVAAPVLDGNGDAVASGALLLQEREDSRVFTIARRVPSLPWRVSAEVPRDAVYAYLHAALATALVLIVGTLALALLAAWFIGRGITRPIRTLAAFAGDLAGRRFDRRIDIATRDELGVLGTALNHAASQLESSEQRIAEEREIRANLGRYLPKQLVDKVANREQSLSLGGERRQITVLFADVAGFTPLAESHPAEHVVIVLNQLFTMITEIVFRHGGTVDKFIGDCVMAFWGAPEDQPDHAARALAAAEDMQSWLEVGNENWERQFGITVELAIGIHSGAAVVGNFGSESRMEYTAIGDTVNVAARLEAMARPRQILISNAVRQVAGERFDYVGLGAQVIAGKRAPIELYEVRI